MLKKYALDWERVDRWRELRAVLMALDISFSPINRSFNHLVELGLIKDPSPLGAHHG